MRSCGEDLPLIRTLRACFKEKEKKVDALRKEKICLKGKGI